MSLKLISLKWQISLSNLLIRAISWQRPTTNIKSDMVCVKLIVENHWMCWHRVLKWIASEQKIENIINRFRAQQTIGPRPVGGAPPSETASELILLHLYVNLHSVGLDSFTDNRILWLRWDGTLSGLCLN